MHAGGSPHKREKDMEMERGIEVVRDRRSEREVFTQLNTEWLEEEMVIKIEKGNDSERGNGRGLERGRER